MAEKTVISIEVEGTGKAINSIKELKAELKAAQSAALNGDGKAAKRVAELKDKMDDLTDSTKSLQGSGVERITSGFDLLGQGFKDFDFDKIKTGFKGLGSAMSAIPIFLLIEGIMLLVQNFEEVVKFFGIGVTESDRLTAALERQKKVNEGLFSVQENAITIMKAEGASMKDILDATEKLNAAKIKAAKDDIELQKLKIKEVFLNDSITESLQRTAASVLRAQGNSRDADLLEAKIQQDKLKRASEFGDQIRTDLITINKLETENRIASIEGDKAKNEQYKKHLEAKKAADDKAKAELEKSKAESDALFESLSKEQDAKLAAANKEKDDLEVQRAKLRNEMKAQQLALDKQEAADFIANEAAKAQAEKDRIKGGFDLAQKSLQATQGLSDAFFSLRQQGAKGDAAKELELKKKQFQANKAFAISNAIMSGVMGVQSQLQAGPIVGPILAGIVAVTAALNVAKIASAKFDGGSIDTSTGGSGGSPSLPSANTNMPSGNGTPSIAAPQQNTTTFTGNNNNNFNQPPIETYVVETDLRNSTNTIDKIKDQATF
jgi:hypothetical protein